MSVRSSGMPPIEALASSLIDYYHELLKVPSTSTGKPDIREVRIFTHEDLPIEDTDICSEDNTFIKASAEEHITPGEYYFAYRNPKARAISKFGALLRGRGSERWRAYPLSQVDGVTMGHKTETLKRTAERGSETVFPETRCFSLVFPSRTLDMVCDSEKFCSIWVQGLQHLIHATRENVKRQAHQRQVYRTGSALVLSPSQQVDRQRRRLTSEDGAVAEGRSLTSTDAVESSPRRSARDHATGGMDRPRSSRDASHLDSERQGYRLNGRQQIARNPLVDNGGRAASHQPSVPLPSPQEPSAPAFSPSYATSLEAERLERVSSDTQSAAHQPPSQPRNSAASSTATTTQTNPTLQSRAAPPVSTASESSLEFEFPHMPSSVSDPTAVGPSPVHAHSHSRANARTNVRKRGAQVPQEPLSPAAPDPGLLSPQAAGLSDPGPGASSTTASSPTAATVSSSRSPKGGRPSDKQKMRASTTSNAKQMERALHLLIESFFRAISIGDLEQVVTTAQEIEAIGYSVAACVHPNLQHTPLEAAVHANRASVLRYLLQQFPDIPFLPNGPNGPNVFTTAVQLGAEDCLREIIRAARPEQRIVLLTLQDMDGNTPLHIAAGNGNVRIVSFLLQHSREEVLERNKEDKTPLHVACYEFIRVFKGSASSRGLFDSDLALETMRMTGSSAMITALLEYERVIRNLVLSGGDVTLIWGDKDGYAPIHIAAKGGSVQLLELLLELGASPLPRNALTLRNAMDEAVDAGQMDVIETLVRVTDEYTDAGFILNDDDVPHTELSDRMQRLVGSSRHQTESTSNRVNASQGSYTISDQEYTYNETGGSGGQFTWDDVLSFQIANTGAQGKGAIYIHPWLQGFDEVHQYPYWFNVETNESTWEIPETVQQHLQTYGLASNFYPVHDSTGNTTALPSTAPGSTGSVNSITSSASCFSSTDATNASFATTVGPHIAPDLPKPVEFKAGNRRLSTMLSIRPDGTSSLSVPRLDGLLSPTKPNLSATLRGERQLSGDELAAAASNLSSRLNVIPETVSASSQSSTCAHASSTATAVGSSSGIISPQALSALSTPMVSRFLNMIKMGVPLSAVEQKMRGEGIEEGTIDLFRGAVESYRKAGKPISDLIDLAKGSGLSGTWKGSVAASTSGDDVVSARDSTPSTQNVSQPKPAADAMPKPPPPREKPQEEAPAAVAPMKPIKSEKEPSGGSSLSFDAYVAQAKELVEANGSTFEKYRKMLAMGIPIGAVRVKMIQEGLSSAEQDAFVTVQDKDEARNLYNKYLKMQADSSDEESDEEEEESAESFAERQAKAKVDVESNAIYGKYLRMKKLGVPLGAIHSQMIKDSMDITTQSVFMTAHADKETVSSLGLMPSKSGKSQSKKDGKPAKKSSRGLNMNPTLKVHWETLELDETRLKKTLWGRLRQKQGQRHAQMLKSGEIVEANGQDLADYEEYDGLLGNSDIALLEKLFAAQSANAAAFVKQSDESGANKRSSLLDFKRANNVNIVLAQFKPFRLTEGKFMYKPLFDSIFSLHHSKEPLKVSDFEKLQLIVPQADEVRQFKSFKGDITTMMECDQFFWEVAHIPRYSNKLTASTFVTSFSQHTQSIVSRASNLSKACQSILKSNRLLIVLGYVLEVGNVLNRGNVRLEGAEAISLDSILKISATKASDKRTSLLDAMIQLIAKQEDSSILSWTEDLGDLREASRIDIQDLRTEVQRLRGHLDQSKQEAELERADLMPKSGSATSNAPTLPVPSIGVRNNNNDGNPDPRAALSNLFAQRAQMASAAVPAAVATAAPSVAIGAEPTEHPCSEEIRKKFVETVHQFCSHADAKISEVEAEVQSTESLSKELVEYFGEDWNKTTPAKVFGVLTKFSMEFRASYAVFRRKQEQEATE